MHRYGAVLKDNKSFKNTSHSLLRHRQMIYHQFEYMNTAVPILPNVREEIM